MPADPITVQESANFFDYGFTYDLTSIELAKSLMLNSCDVFLIERIDKKFDELDL
jgi:hypothetical protein